MEATTKPVADFSKLEGLSKLFQKGILDQNPEASKKLFTESKSVDVQHLRSNAQEEIQIPAPAQNAKPSQMNFNLSEINITRIMISLQTSAYSTMATNAENSRVNIKSMQAQLDDILKEITNKLNEYLDSLKSSDIWGSIKKAFSYIGSVLMMAVGAVLIASGVGVAAGVLLMAAGAMMFLSQLSEDTGGWMVKGFTEMYMAMGMDEEKAKLAAQITIVAIILVLSIASMCCGGGSALASLEGQAAQIMILANRAQQAAQVAYAAADTGQLVYDTKARQANIDITNARTEQTVHRSYLQEWSADMKADIDASMQMITSLSSLLKFLGNSSFQVASKV
ncbi:hypothetical protein [Pleionea sp. CnH1-48]|uniref:hypothetical protein n=1 Tax=Pleionea sp. CnH1-48 TaxID=2954494 RepID=UPI0020983E44|nr:hypothetical protein [Pleionea sp. CnH1-48]MCO7226999.1 hypothetical protein [Pleionea sp. CnH1-48]